MKEGKGKLTLTFEKIKDVSDALRVLRGMGIEEV
jgi:hypothetical protein